MRRRACLLTLIVLGLACSLASAQDTQGNVMLQYAPQVGDHEDSAVVGKLTDLQMNGASLGLTGQVSGTAKLDVAAARQDTGEFTLNVAFDNLKAEFSGQPREPHPIAPAAVTMSRRGEVLKVQRLTDKPDTGADAGLGALTSGGVPLDVVMMLATSVRFPEKPVAVGQSWTLTEERDLPVVGKTKVLTVTRLLKLEGHTATLESQASSDVPAFEMDNPLLEGKIKVQSGKFTATRIEREFDMTRSVVVRAKGSFKIEMLADIGMGVPTPLAALAEFDLRPPQAATTATPTPAPAAPAAPTQVGSARKLTVGPLSASAGYAAGTAELGLGIDLSRVPLPASLAQYRALVSAARVGCSLEAGVAGSNAGRVALGGQAQLGPLALKRELAVNLKDLACRLAQLGLGLVRSD